MGKTRILTCFGRSKNSTKVCGLKPTLTYYATSVAVEEAVDTEYDIPFSPWPSNYRYSFGSATVNSNVYLCWQ